MLLSMINHWNF